MCFLVGAIPALCHVVIIYATKGSLSRSRAYARARDYVTKGVLSRSRAHRRACARNRDGRNYPGWRLLGGRRSPLKRIKRPYFFRLVTPYLVGFRLLTSPFFISFFDPPAPSKASLMAPPFIQNSINSMSIMRPLRCLYLNRHHASGHAIFFNLLPFGSKLNAGDTISTCNLTPTKSLKCGDS